MQHNSTCSFNTRSCNLQYIFGMNDLQANCALALNGVSTTYGACATLQGEPSPYRLYYTYDAAASTITGAFAYPNPTGWVAWGCALFLADKMTHAMCSVTHVVCSVP